VNLLQRFKRNREASLGDRKHRAQKHKFKIPDEDKDMIESWMRDDPALKQTELLAKYNQHILVGLKKAGVEIPEDSSKLMDVASANVRKEFEAQKIKSRTTSMNILKTS